MKKILNDFIESSKLAEGVAWRSHHYSAKDIVVKEGDPATSFFYIEKGSLRVTRSVYLDEEKRIQPGVSDLNEGTIFGESCLHKTSPRIATVQAITEVSLLEFNGERLAIYLDDNPVKGYLFYKNLFEIIIGRLDNSNHTVESLMAWGLKAHKIDQYL